jgi:hypothetical protein
VAHANFSTHTSVFFVTRGGINGTNNTIALDETAEQGGRKMLYRKTLRLLHHVAYDEAFANGGYDWVVKADDDTYVNTDRLSTVLGRLDPSVPLFVGSARFTLATARTSSSSSSSLSAVQGVSVAKMVRKGDYFRELEHYAMCHGGAGYALSRRLLSLLAPRLRRCEVEPPQTQMEDAKLSFCVGAHTGLQCLGLHGSGGFDVLSNARLGDDSTSRVNALSPAGYLGGATFHRVSPWLMHAIHASLSTLRGDTSAVASVAMETDLFFSDHRKFVATWNCSVGGRLSGWSAVCQRCALRSPPPRLKRVTAPDGSAAWRLIARRERGATLKESVVGGSAGGVGGGAAATGDGGVDGSTPGARTAADCASNNLVVVLVPQTGDNMLFETIGKRIAAIATSLRAARSNADVVVVVHRSVGPAFVAGAVDATRRGVVCAVVVPSTPAEAPTDRADPMAAVMAAAAGYLADHASAYTAAVVCPLGTLFVGNPFAEHRMGVGGVDASGGGSSNIGGGRETVMPEDQVDRRKKASDADKSGLWLFVTTAPPPLLTVSPPSKVRGYPACSPMGKAFFFVSSTAMHASRPTKLHTAVCALLTRSRTHRHSYSAHALTHSLHTPLCVSSHVLTAHAAVRLFSRTHCTRRHMLLISCWCAVFSACALQPRPPSPQGG